MSLVCKASGGYKTSSISERTPSTLIFSLPLSALAANRPADLALQQLQEEKKIQNNCSEHNLSLYIYYIYFSYSIIVGASFCLAARAHMGGIAGS